MTAYLALRHRVYHLLPSLAILIFSISAEAQFQWQFAGRSYPSKGAAEAALKAHPSPQYLQFAEPWFEEILWRDPATTLHRYTVFDYQAATDIDFYGYTVDKLCGFFDGTDCHTDIQDAVDSSYPNPTAVLCDVRYEVTGEFEFRSQQWEEVLDHGIRFWASESAPMRVDFFHINLNSGNCEYGSSFNQTLHRIHLATCNHDLSPISGSFTQWESVPEFPKVCSPSGHEPPMANIANISKRLTNVCTSTEGNPCSPMTGHKSLKETDFKAGSIEITRRYNSSLQLGQDSLGKGWNHNYSSRLISSGGYTLIKPDGNVEEFSIATHGDFRSITTPGKMLTVAEDLAQLTYPGGRKEIYQLARASEHGPEQFRLIEIFSADMPDRATTLGYGEISGLLETVTGPFGRQVQFQYEPAGLLSTLVLPDGSRIEYAHDTHDNLTEITFQDGSKRSYLYEDSSLPNHLTGIIDENGGRFATYRYDEFGRVTLSEHAGGADRVRLNYIDDETTEVTSSLGDVRNYFFDPYKPSFDVSDIVDGNGTTTFSRNSEGWTLSETDAAGQSTRYSYDEFHEISRVEGAGTAEQRQFNYTWDNDLNRKTRIEETGSVTNYTFDEHGRTEVKTIQDPSGGASRTWTYNYFSASEGAHLAGRLQSADGPRTDVADVTSYDYYTTDDAAGRYRAGDLQSVVNAAGHTTVYLEYDGNGRVVQIRDANGVITETRYHPRGWISGLSVDGRLTGFSYDNTGNLVRMTSPDGSYVGYAYDDAHRLVETTDSLGNRIEYTLDPAGNRIEENTFDEQNTLRRHLSRTFNALSQLEQLTDSNGHTVRFSYDSNGSRSSTRDQNGNITRYEYDALNRLVKAMDPLQGETLMAFDDRDKLTHVTDPLGNVTRYQYDGLDNPVSIISPDTGTTASEFDSAGNRIVVTDARGVRIEYRYDELNRVTDTLYPDSSRDVYLSYDAGSFGKGRLTGMTDQAGSVSYEYNAQGKLLSEIRLIGEQQYLTRYSYNSAGRLIQIEYPSGTTIDLSLDGTGRTIALHAGAQTLVEEVRYAPFGPVSSFNYGNGLSFSAEFNLDYERVQLESGSGQILSLDYGPAGNIRSINNQAFTYDELHRLASTSGDTGSQIFEYDANGNRLHSQHDLNISSYTYEINSNRLHTAGDWLFTHDRAGNRTSKLDSSGHGQLFSYGDHNRLEETIDRSPSGDRQSGSYLHDGKGRRVVKSTPVGETHFIYNPSGQLLGEYSALGDGIYREYVYLHGNPVALLSRTIETTTPPGDELILDNGDPGTLGAGNWRSKTSNQDFGSGYLYATKSANTSYRWTATPPGDKYRVYAWWVDRKNQSGNVRYTISHAGGQIDSVTKSQKTGGGQWQLLGSYSRGNGQDYVEVSSDDNKFTADAMRWVAVNDPIVTLSEQTHFIHYDHLGSPRSVTNRDQAIIWNWESNPFGDSLPNQDPDGDSSEFVLNLRFPGQYYDAESGLHYNYFRTYDPETGRYLESDPIGLRSSLNTFAYVDNNPVNAVDPKGLIKLYGSWCGPDWTGGFRKSYDELGSVERSAALPPVDNLDQCCQVHDITYSDCRSDYPCDPELRQRCFQNADRRLSQCANTSGGGQSPQFLMFGNPRKRIEDYMKDSIPEAEENAASCGCE